MSAVEVGDDAVGRAPGPADLPTGPWRPHRSAVVAVVAWAALILLARAVGLAYVRAHSTPLAVGAVPFFGRWDAYLGARTALPLLLAAGCVWALPPVAARAPWRSLLALTASATAAISAALAWAGPGREGWLSVEAGFGRHVDLVSAHGPGGLLRDYVALQPDLSSHLRAHPPGLLLGLWGLDRFGLRGPGTHLVLVLAAVAASAVAALVAVDEVAGRRRARAAAPFLAVVPAAVWHTNPDCIYGALGLTAVALLVRATGQQGRRSDLLAAAAGLVMAAALLVSYGSVLLVVPALVVAAHRRALRPVAVAAAAGTIGLLLPALWGFWWPAGLAQTRVQYHHSIGRVRGYRYWLLGNAAVLATLVGPATAVALARIREADAGLRALVAGGAAAVGIAAVSGLTSAETERIWQPFVPLLLVSCGVLWSGTAEDRQVRAARGWLSLQAGVMVALQATLRSPW